MHLKRVAGALCSGAFLLFVCIALNAGLAAQGISGSLVGTVTDASGAVIPGAQVHIVKNDTSVARDIETGRDGAYSFPNLSPGQYAVTITATGFKDVSLKNVVVTADQQLDLGKTAMAVGSQNETVTVTAAVTPIQTSSSEVSTSINGDELNAEPLRGRDLFGAMKLDAGVLDTDMSRNVTEPYAIEDIVINGNAVGSGNSIDFTVDGQTDMDGGSNETVNVEPNMDAVQEITVLTSNYQAEYGRNSGGTIAVVTKSGTSQYHGTGWWNHRHEEFNANTYFNNANGTIRPKYRFNVAGWSFGGPVPIASLKDKLFFFASQEYTNQLGSTTTEYITEPTPQELGEVPTADALSVFPTVTNPNGGPLEEKPVAAAAGATPGEYPFDFADALNNGGKAPLTIYEPCSVVEAGGGTNCGDGSGGKGTPYPGNVIPNCTASTATASCPAFSSAGLKMLGYLPSPNYLAPLGSTEYGEANYTDTATGGITRRNDVIRVDYDINPRLTTYVRWMHDADVTSDQFEDGNSINIPANNPNPGHDTLWSTTFVISPTLINEFDMSEGNDNWDWYYDLNGANSTTPPSGILASAVGNPPTLLTIPTSPEGVNGYNDLMPEMTYGSAEPNMATAGGNGNLLYVNSNPIYILQDNVSKVAGTHQIKFGLYVEDNWKLQPSGVSYEGDYNFENDLNDPNDTGDGYANAVLGNYDSFSQNTGRVVFNVNYWNVEWYAQDNWRMTKKLSLDYGLRFYHQTPMADTNDTFAVFNPSLYSSSNIAKLYTPYCSVASTAASPCPALDEYAQAPSGALAPLSYIGDYVPGTGTYFDGMQQLGVNGASDDPYTNDWLKVAPRIGFAYDVFGDGKTAIRGGFGVFYSRLDGNEIYEMSGEAPVTYSENVSYANISGITTGGAGVVAPPNITEDTGFTPLPEVRNASLGIEHELGFNTSIDVSYVGTWDNDTDITYGDNINPVALGAEFTPTLCADCGISAVTGAALTQASDSLIRTNYVGYGNIENESFAGHDNYNALETTVSHRLSNGFLLSAAWTWSKALGTTSYDPLVPNNNERNYGPTAYNRPEQLQINYSYLLPSPGKALGSALMGDVTDGWTLSGLTTFESGAPWTPTGNNLNNADYTGSPNETARAIQIGDPFVNVPAGELYNPAAYEVPPNGTESGVVSLGNVGVNPFQLPSWENWDMTMTKFIPAGFDKESGFQVQFAAFNVFNHPEMTSWQTVFNAADFGVPNNTNPARIMSFNLRYQF